MLENCNDLRDCESVLSQKIGEISLLGQIVLSEDDVHKLGDLISSWMAFFYPTEGTECLRDEAPASLCCFLVWIGIFKYRAGDYWSAVHQAAKLPEEPSWQKKWGQIFLTYLRAKGLPTFDDVGGHRYVTPILAHGGIPDYCLEDFFRNLLLPIVSGHLVVDITDTEEILQEWQERSSLFEFTDKPVRRFLVYGRKAAADFLSRCIEMAQRAYEEGEVPNAEEVDIPPRIVQRFEQLWQPERNKRYAERDKRHERQKGSRFRRPIVFLTPEFGEVSIQIPKQIVEVDIKEDALCIEIIAGHEGAFQQKLRCYRKNGLLETEETSIRLPSPAEKYEVRLLRKGTVLQTWSFEGLTKDNPWMAFEKTTQRMIQSKKLPCTSVWLVFSKYRSLESGISILEEGQPFYGRWATYYACLIDVASMRCIRLRDEGGAEYSILVTSETSSELELTGGEVIPLVFCDGEPVYSTAPSLRISLTEQLSRWSLSVIPQGKTTLDARRDYNLANLTIFQMDEIVAEVSLSDYRLLGTHPAGRFLVRLRGPLGKDRSFCFALLPGLRAQFDKQLYVPTCEKAPDAELTMAMESAEEITPEQLCYLTEKYGGRWVVKVPETESRVRLTLYVSQKGCERIELPVEVRVPRLGLAVQGVKGESTWQWSHTVREISIEQWEESETLSLLVNIPGINEGNATLSLQGGNQEVQQQSLQGKIRCELKRFSDTLKVLGQPLTYFNLSFLANRTSFHDVPVLAIHTEWVVEELHDYQEIKEGRRIIHLAWKDRGRVRNRVVRLWNLWRPWEVPFHVNVPDNDSERSIECPIEDLPPGEYRIEFAIEDPWVGTSVFGLAPPSDDRRIFSFSVGECKEPLTYPGQLDSTFKSNLEWIARQRLAGIQNLQQEITRISIVDVLTDDDLEALAGLLLSWLPDSGFQAHHAEILWVHLLREYNNQFRNSFTARFLCALGRFVKNRDQTIKQNARRLCLLTGLIQVPLQVPCDCNINDSDRNTIWDLWPLFGLFLDLSDPDPGQLEYMVQRCIRTLGEQPLKDIFGWFEEENFAWPDECQADFSECLMCRLGLARQCDKLMELNYSPDYYGGNETKDLDLLIKKEREDLHQILESLQLDPIGLLHKDTYLNAIANWILQMKEKKNYPTVCNLVAKHVAQCDAVLREIAEQEELRPIVDALRRRFVRDHRNKVLNLPFLVGSTAFVQRLMARGFYHTFESEKWKHHGYLKLNDEAYKSFYHTFESEKWKHLGIKVYQVAPELYERDLCLFDLSLWSSTHHNTFVGSVVP